MELLEKQKGDNTHITLSGKLDASTTPATEARLLELLRSGNKYLLLDFSSVTYLASSGLRMLLVVVKQIAALEGRLVLCNLDTTMRDTLEVTGFLPYFTLADNAEEGWKALEK